MLKSIHKSDNYISLDD